MSKKAYLKLRPYMYLVPLLFLFAMGILYRSTIQTATVEASPSCDTNDVSGVLDFASQVAYWEGKAVEIPSTVLAQDTVRADVLGVANPEERWIEVDLSDQRLRAWDGDNLYVETPISTGLPGTPTPTGEFRIWMKLRATRMEGGVGRYYYNLPNVPYVMFFSNDKVASSLGYGLHGTYWHNDFGNPRSHGCVNLPTPVAKILYEWTTPVLASGKTIVRSDSDNPGTRIVIHD